MKIATEADYADDNVSIGALSSAGARIGGTSVICIVNWVREFGKCKDIQKKRLE